jgi:two-component sensor histidine kinase
MADRKWTGADLDDVMRASLRQQLADGQVQLAGESLPVQPRTAVALSLALHELATNALKYGALSSAGGRVAVSWTAKGERFRLIWRESGGPKVQTPTRRGFGIRMIQEGLAAELSGESRSTIGYRSERLICIIAAALAAVCESDSTSLRS